jgi:cytochrome c oxidase subunit 4
MTAIDTNAELDTHDDAHDHPSDRKYVMIALILGALTAVEILMFVFEDNLPRGLVKIGLIALMGVKFWIVGAYFMHLKFDNSILWQLFTAGLILAIVVYFIMLSAFEFSFWNDGFDDAGLPGGGS